LIQITAENVAEYLLIARRASCWW